MTVAAMKVIEGIEFEGQVNVGDDRVLQNVAAAIRRGHPQVWQTGLKSDRVVLVGSGPSLAETERDLVALVREGAKLVTLNGAYHWCLDRNLAPSAQVVMDARPSTARFLEPALPSCRYYLASQCDAAAWDTVAGRPFVGIWHAISADDGPMVDLLNQFYLKRWTGIPGGTTVLTRALMLLRTLGYLRFDLFGCDSCWLDGAHHALDQPENATDKQVRLDVAPTGAPEQARTFTCAPWMVKQAEDFLMLIRARGDQFALRVHGPGLLAFMVEASADVSVVKE